MYKNKRDESLTEVIGACLNDLAYLLIFDKEDVSYDLTGAREALVELKQTVPKDKWKRFYPEYLHTEAAIEYYEVLQGLSQSNDPALLKTKLLFAKRDIEAAIQVLPKKLYMTLRKDIDHALNLLETGLERFLQG